MEHRIYISVIIPVFNAAENIDKSFTSLLNQKYKYLEIIIINDCSTDGSLSQLLNWKYQFEKNEYIVCKIISHEKNRGVAAARNTGLDNATGEYIYYLDADDTIECNALSALSAKATIKQSDIVGCNWILSFQKRHKLMYQTKYTSSMDGLNGILTGKIRWNLWLFLVKRSLYESHNIRFIEGLDMGEDLLVTTKLFHYAKKVDFVDKHLYNYNQLNNESLTKTYNHRHIYQVTENVNELEKFLNKESSIDNINYKIAILKLNIKLPLLISNKSENYDSWKDWFSDSNKYILDKKNFNFRIRLIQWSALNKLYIINKIYYNLFVNLIYGVIYK